MTTFVAYSPRFALDWLATEPACRFRTVDASLTFLDLSGFTAMSERLARVGREGAEEVADVINSTFTELLAVAYGLEGGLVKFGGDALLLMFDGPGHERRAVAAAAGMRSRLRAIGRIGSSAGWVRLGMSVGVHSGQIHAFLVGDTHRELVLTGPAASTVVEMEGTASRGQIVVSSATAGALPRGCVGEPVGAGFLLRRSPNVPPVDRAPSRAGREWEQVAADLVPVMLRESIGSGGGDPEHRQVAIAFVHFDGADALATEVGGSERLAGELDALVSAAQAACAEHGVCFLGTDVDGDGGKLVLTAGAPFNSENDEERLLRAVRALFDAHDSRALPIRAGVHRGAALAGVIGPPYRRTYTAMGDAVNTAARVMAHARRGEVLATPEVLGRSETTFATVEVAPFAAKGKRRQLRAESVGAITGAREGGRRDLPIVGRQDELAALGAACARAVAGTGTVLELVGEAGVGKTRLIEEVERDHGHVHWLRVSASRFDAAVPYAVAARLLLQALGGTEGASPTVIVEKLRARVEEAAPELLPWLPLVGLVLGIDVPSTPEFDALDRGAVRDRIAATAADVLAALAPAATGIVVDGLQWCDDASMAVVRSIATAVTSRPWILVLARRPGDSSLVHGAELMELGPLGARATIELGQEIAGSSVAPHALTHAAERSAGNPLFLVQILVALAGRPADDPGALPDTVEASIAARIDRLAPPDRSFLRHAAVAGDGCSLEALEQVLPPGAAHDMRRAVDRLSEFVVAEGGALHFRFPLVQDVAYAAMPFKRRRALHGEIGRLLEATAPDPDAIADVLYQHFAAAGDGERVWRYARIAADRARTRYAYEAEALARRCAVDAGRTLEVPPPALRAAWQALGDAWQATGRFVAARRAYRAARALVGGDAEALARLCLLEGGLWQDEGRYSAALRWYRRGLAACDGMGTTPPGELARTEVRLREGCAAVAYHQGRFDVARDLAESALRESQRSADRPGEGHALVLLHLIAIARRDEDAEAVGRRALALLRELGLAGEAATVLNNLGLSEFERGRLDAASELYAEAIEAYESSGRLLEAAIVRNNLAEVASDQGKWHEAADGFRRARAAMKATGFQFEPLVASNLARLAARQGRYAEAIEGYAEAIADASAMGAPWYEAEMRLRVAECHLLAGDPGRALADLRAVDVPEAARTFAMRIEGAALAASGETERGRRVLLDAADRAGATGEQYEGAMARYELGLLGDHEQAGAAAEALASLGMVELPARTNLGATEFAPA